MLSRNDDWSARHSVRMNARRTAALVNALTAEEPTAGGTAAEVAAAVAGVLREYGETGSLEFSAGDLAELRTAAVMLRDVFVADGIEGAAAVLNRLLAHSQGPLRLTAHGGAGPWHPHLDSDDDAPWGEWFLASSCLALTVLVWDRQRAPGGVCASAGCHRVFVTEGSGPARRYCSRRCATRERVAAHRRGRQGAQDSGGPGGSGGSGQRS
ncbi:CGNR zinc finger domain-containing protein [Streptomyces sp. NPDC002055]|uniref:CGNR zinc finger domain-containing protein n=1 Tax=Streptomyces sp. NPDC002055 TaxID=3154534 RepID=UPI00332C2ED1